MGRWRRLYKVPLGGFTSGNDKGGKVDAIGVKTEVGGGGGGMRGW